MKTIPTAFFAITLGEPEVGETVVVEKEVVEDPLPLVVDPPEEDTIILDDPADFWYCRECLKFWGKGTTYYAMQYEMEQAPDFWPRLFRDWCDTCGGTERQNMTLTAIPLWRLNA